MALDYYDGLVVRAGGRLLMSEEQVYLADVNFLAAALYEYEDSRREMLSAVFGDPEDGESPGALPDASPMTPAIFDRVFSGPRKSGLS